MTINKQDVRRYDDMGSGQICPINNMYESDDGNYVLYEDYKALQAENDRLRAKLAAMESRSMAWLVNALEQYANGDVVTVPAGAGTEEEFFAWLKDQGSDGGTAGAVPEDISALIEKVRKWGVEHTGNEPSVSCFHRALDDLQAAIARPLPAAKPARITEHDARVLIESAMHHYIFNDRSTNIDVWFKEKGKALLNKLNADRQVPDAIQLLQRVSDSTTDKPAVAVPDGYASRSSFKVFSSGNAEGLVIYRSKTDERCVPVFFQSHSQQSAESDIEIVQKALDKTGLELRVGKDWILVCGEDEYSGDDALEVYYEGWGSLLAWAKQTIRPDRCPSHESEQGD